MSNINGTVLNDTLAGTPADDTVIGDTGIDILLISALSNSATFSLDEEGRWVVSGPQGSDTLEGVESVRFNDSSVNLGRQETGVGSGLYGNQGHPAIAALAGGGHVVAWTSERISGGNDFYVQRFDARGFEIGSPTLVNTTTSLNQNNEVIAALPDGGFVVAWESDHGNSTSRDIYMRRFDAQGLPVSGETLVNSHLANSQWLPTVTVLDGGGFVVAWQSMSQDGSDWGIYAQRFDASGNATGVETRVNTTLTSAQDEPSVAALSDGGYVVTWESLTQGGGSDFNIYGQRFDANGAAQGAEFRVNTTTSGFQNLADVTGLSTGGFVVTWQSASQDGSSWGIYAQRYDASGVQVGGELRVNTTTQASQESPVVRATPDGGFIVAWTSNHETFDPLAGEYTGVSVYAQRFDASGSQAGEETRVPVFSDGQPSCPVVTLLSSGQSVIAWQANHQDGSGWGLYARICDYDGNPVGEVIRINETTLDEQTHPAIVALDNGGFMVTWQSRFDDGSGWGVYGRSFFSDGSAQDDEARLTEVTDGDQSAPALLMSAGSGYPNTAFSVSAAVLSGGGPLAVWQSASENDDGWDIHARALGRDGAPFGSEFIVNSTLPGDQINAAGATFNLGYYFPPQFAPLSGQTVPGGIQADTTLYSIGGGCVVVWQSQSPDSNGWDIQLQRYDAYGAPMGSEVRVNTITDLAQTNPAVTTLTNGAFVVTWESEAADGSGHDIYARFYDDTPQSVETRVNTFTASAQSRPVIAAIQGQPVFASALAGDTLQTTPSTIYGGYVIAWQSAAQDGFGWSIHAQRFDADGTPQGDEILVNTGMVGEQTNPSITALWDGGFSVTWESSAQADGSGAGIFARNFDAFGAPVGPEHRINDRTSSTQMTPTLAVQADGSYVIGWESMYQSGGQWSVHDRLFDADGNPLGSGPVLNGDDGINTLRFEGPESVALMGYGDNDTLQSGTGNDTLDGGAGIDTLIVPGQHSSLAWQLDGQRKLMLSGPGSGTDQLVSIDKVQTGDGVVAVSYASADLEINLPTRYQSNPTVTGLNGGGYVATWTSFDDDGSGVFTQFHDADGTPIGPALRVNAVTTNDQSSAAVSALPDGGCLITYMSTGQDGSSAGVYAQRYDADGVPAGGEFRVNTTTAGSQYSPSIATLSSGGWVISWESAGQDSSGAGIYLQRYNASGVPQGSETRVNTFTAGDQSAPSVIALNGAAYAVTWRSADQDGSSGGIYAQRFDAGGAATGGEVHVSTHTSNDQRDARGAGLADGSYVMVWRSVGQDGDGSGIFTQRFEANGLPAGVETRVNTTTAGDQFNPVIAPMEDGGYRILWTSHDSEGWGIYAQRFDSGGHALAGETRVNTAGGTYQDAPALTPLADGGYLVTWMNYGYGDSRSGIAGQRFDSSGLRQGHLTLTGGNENNVLRVSASEGVELLGGEGSDTLAGGAGGDVLHGGSASDIFEYAAAGNGVDTIADWAQGDRIVIAGASLTGPMTTGTGTGLLAGQTQIMDFGGLTRLYIGTDDIPGYDVQIVLAGGWTPDYFAVSGNTITNNLNHLPTGTVTITGTPTQGQPLTASNTLADADGMGLVSYQWQADGMDISGATGSTFTPAQAQVGHTISVLARFIDGFGTPEQVSSAATVPVANVNDAPTASDISAIGYEDSHIDGLLPAAFDLDGDPVTYAKASEAAHGTVTVLPDRNYNYTPAANYNGPDSFTYSVNDGHGGSNSYTVNLTVTPVNDAPTLAHEIPDQVATEGSAFVFTVPANTFADIDAGDTFTYVALLSNATPLPAWLSFDAATRTFTGTPRQAQVGEVYVRVIATDSGDAHIGDTFRLSVDNVNDPPTAVDTSASTSEDQVLNGTLPAGSDPDSDNLTHAKASDPAHGSVTVQPDGNFTYTPAANYFGPDNFSYSIDDGHGATDIATVSLTVTPVNDAPLASPGSASGAEDVPLNGTVIATDIDSASLTYSTVAQPAHGSVVVQANGAFTYTPAANYFGADSFTFKANDGNLDSNVATVSLTVTPVNDAPTGSVAFTGLPVVGQTLSASNTLADVEGLGTVSYHWRAGGLDIAGATGSTYTLTSADVGKSISVLARYTDGGGTPESVPSAASSPVTAFNTVTGTSGPDVLNGITGADSILGLGGNDTINGLGGMDTINGGAGTDTVLIGAPVSGVLAYSLISGVLSVTTASGTQTLSQVERVKLTDALFAFDTQAPSGSEAGGHVWQAAALLRAGFGAMPDQANLSRWTAEADSSASMGVLGQKIIDFYAPGISSDAFVGYLYQMLVHTAPTPDVLQGLVSQIGAGQTFATQGDLFAYAASLSLNTDLMVGFAGSVQVLDAGFFG